MQTGTLAYSSARERVIWHVVFWAAVVAYHALILGAYSGSYSRELTWELVALPPKMAITYLTLYVLLPRFFLRRRFVRFAAWVTAGVLVAALFQRLIEWGVVREFSNPYERADVFLHPLKVLRAVIGIYPVVALAAFLKVGKLWVRRDAEAEVLRSQSLEAELRFLRTQMQPHFLFNTLNNLYALTLRGSDRAADAVLKLSAMMEYLLRDTGQNRIPLAKEIEAIETYLELERLRYGERLDLRFRVAGEAAGAEIHSMLLLPFVENAFKHGVGKRAGGGSVDIDLEVTDRLRFRVANSIPSQEAPTGSEPGIGLENVRRRLELLYGDRYHLELARRDGTFRVDLTIPL